MCARRCLAAGVLRRRGDAFLVWHCCHFAGALVQAQLFQAVGLKAIPAAPPLCVLCLWWEIVGLVVLGPQPACEHSAAYTWCCRCVLCLRCCAWLCQLRSTLVGVRLLDRGSYSARNLGERQHLPPPLGMRIRCCRMLHFWAGLTTAARGGPIPPNLYDSGRTVGGVLCVRVLRGVHLP